MQIVFINKIFYITKIPAYAGIFEKVDEREKYLKIL